ncbi:MAG TPA: hypothetical protein VNZ64_27610 [Candidatus Acidoferrum sp.]|jgi:hypothetical protein|nr:hypothetical protein [Candidatus Acidoferrum sp.]
MIIRIHGRDRGGVVSAVESHEVPREPDAQIHHREDKTFQIDTAYFWSSFHL